MQDSKRPESGLYVQIERKASQLREGDLIVIAVDDCSKPLPDFAGNLPGKHWMFISSVVKVVRVGLPFEPKYAPKPTTAILMNPTVTISFDGVEHQLYCKDDDKFTVVLKLYKEEDAQNMSI